MFPPPLVSAPTAFLVSTLCSASCIPVPFAYSTYLLDFSQTQSATLPACVCRRLSWRIGRWSVCACVCVRVRDVTLQHRRAKHVQLQISPSQFSESLSHSVLWGTSWVCLFPSLRPSCWTLLTLSLDLPKFLLVPSVTTPLCISDAKQFNYFPFAANPPDWA